MKQAISFFGTIIKRKIYNVITLHYKGYNFQVGLIRYYSKTPDTFVFRLSNIVKQYGHTWQQWHNTGTLGQDYANGLTKLYQEH